MVNNSLSWVVSSTQSKRTCRDNYIKSDAWKYEELVTPRGSVTRIIICDSLDLAMILKRAFHVTSQSQEKGVHMRHMQNALQSWQLMDLPHMFKIEFRLPHTNPYVLVDQDGKSVADLYHVMKMLYTQTWSYDCTVIVYQLVTFYRQLSCW